MYTLLYRVRGRAATLVECLALAISLLLAEFLYKFHSFSLECLCFLGTWLFFGALFSAIHRIVLRVRGTDERAAPLEPRP
jgi:hypothetical protein